MMFPLAADAVPPAVDPPQTKGAVLVRLADCVVRVKHLRGLVGELGFEVVAIEGDLARIEADLEAAVDDYMARAFDRYHRRITPVVTAAPGSYELSGTWRSGNRCAAGERSRP